MTDVHLNGKYVGTCKEPEKFVANVKELRRSGKVSPELNISYKKEEDIIIMLSENGRAIRPLVVVEDGKSKLTKEILDKLKANKMKWGDLVKNGIIEYLDSEEEEDSYIALWEKDITKEHTHLEISPLIIFGIQTGMVPYAEHNLSVRVLIGAKTVKQALGLYSSNYRLRVDTDVSTLHYPQKPVVSTQMYDLINYHRHPVGQNIVLAIASFEGYNMDDAIIFNKSSIERGIYRSTYYRPYKAEELRYPGGQVDAIESPDKEVAGYKTEENYRFLEDDGIVYPDAELGEEDVLIGKTSPPKFLSTMEEYKLGNQGRRDTSVSIKHGEEGVVDSVIITENEEGNKYIRVKMRNEKIPEIGDKLATRHGQKGVIGMIYPYED
ncbi:MAG: DNA-directed RNA polymerase subunit B, partial [Candidatus Nanoarchaeia archaeon]|nr:DNA-directed RNA polymerase subunit B [Candidatus Nanoarchaeia archaeon]